MQRKIIRLMSYMFLCISMVACGVSETERRDLSTSIAGSIFATQTAQSLPSMPEMPPAISQVCPVPTESTQLLQDEEAGYCLLYPEGLSVVIPFAGEVCLVPEDPPDPLQCAEKIFSINVEAADGRTAGQVADAVAADKSCSDERYTLTIGNEKAVALSDCMGQDLSRVVFIIHADHLYTLTFIDLSERFYAQIITSFAFSR